MAFLEWGATIAKAYGLDAATRPDCHFLVVHPAMSHAEKSPAFSAQERYAMDVAGALAALAHRSEAGSSMEVLLWLG